MKSYRQCFEFINAAKQWVSRHEEESKFKYALTKVSRKLGKAQEKWQELVEESNIEHCATDKDGVILRDERGQYKYVKEELIKRNKRVNRLYDTEFDVEPHFVTEVPEDVTELEKEVFEGFVLKPEQVTDLEVVNS